jgi:hypothetical protein
VAVPTRERVRELVRLFPRIAGVVALRYGAYAVMTAMALWNEARPAPTLPDAVLGAVPYVLWVGRLNYFAWLVLYVPLAFVLLWTTPERWIRYMVTGAILSIARGVCIVLTGLGAPDPRHVGVAIHGRAFGDVYLELLSPLGVFSRGAHAYLSKDLFFSGHTSTTFLLVLYLWDRPRLRLAALAAHIIVVATVILSHLHYSIDVVGAWAVTFAVFALREWQPRAVRSHARSDAG